MRIKKVFSLKIGGCAGQGVKSLGLLFSKCLLHLGYKTYSYIEYPSLIKGGHNVVQISVSQNQPTGPTTKTDFLVALNRDTLDKHLGELEEGAGVLLDLGEKENTLKVSRKVKFFGIPLANISGEKYPVSNVIALGALVALFGGELTILNGEIEKEYRHEKSMAENLKAAKLGFDFIKKNYPKESAILNPLESLTESPDKILDGNEAVSLGAISAGLEFASIYPMSPISGIIHFLASHQKTHNYIYKQPEDEISAINMAIGASFAGARSLVATSGGGFCLMTEGFGLAGITETPLVVIEGMRGAPATGLATFSEQGDLSFVLNAHQGDFPRIVLAAGDIREAFDLTRKAFNLADKYQTPVVVLLDKNICDNSQSISLPNSPYTIDRGKLTTDRVENYKRYILSKDGISTRTLPGSGNFFIANSEEHNEFGYSSEDSGNRISQMEKRMLKLETCAKKDMAPPTLYGSKNAELTIVSWGSCKGSILQALKDFNNVNFLHLMWLNPFPAKEVETILSQARYIIAIEGNYSAQMARLIREKTGIEIKDKFLKYDGRPFFVEDITDKIHRVLKDIKNG
ncbi:2-oxoacid:acceptor oxidoreductase subunit alpha [candidate division WWE3 bacterium CG09_land_8_20_14_0_10_39_24]|uniref:2-oxoacid:acceptor oxidoreductase subunit alpha n=1 Tax=candidate division WWE3 bacterium CG09_land_8_20_14_0_10_39_24 TaxID=1975088 RepID=A0A2H0WIX4_UNCKA|nr:MAG: hypothetical protein BK003_03040 [bacterium CG09_39_24]PIS12606.1 MAG: 2-oxoacid:acceptor oxidoreductase subunit alpha [candidate division WWE3 bacterium CG09_land_8_20_14_0_10_39_24]